MILYRNFTSGQPKSYIISLCITQQWNKQVCWILTCQLQIQNFYSQHCLKRNHKEPKLLFPCRQVDFIQVLEISVLRTPDPEECKHFLLKAGFCYAQVPFKTGSHACPLLMHTCWGIFKNAYWPLQTTQNICALNSRHEHAHVRRIQI